MAALLNSLFFVFTISFLPKYRVICYDYNYCKVVRGISLSYALCILSLFRVLYVFKGLASTCGAVSLPL